MYEIYDSLHEDQYSLGFGYGLGSSMAWPGRVALLAQMEFVGVKSLIWIAIWIGNTMPVSC